MGHLLHLSARARQSISRGLLAGVFAGGLYTVYLGFNNNDNHRGLHYTGKIGKETVEFREGNCYRFGIECFDNLFKDTNVLKVTQPDGVVREYIDTDDDLQTDEFVVTRAGNITTDLSDSNNPAAKDALHKRQKEFTIYLDNIIIAQINKKIRGLEGQMQMYNRLKAYETQKLEQEQEDFKK